MQLLAKFKKKLYMGFRATLNFPKFSTASRVFHLHVFRALPLTACFTAEHSTVEASLFVN